MKKRVLRFTTGLCAFAFLLAMLPMTASGAGGETPLKVKPTTAETANFMLLTNRGNGAPPYYSSSGWFYDTNFIVLEGYKKALGVGSMDDAWDFTLYINALYKRNGVPPGEAPMTTVVRNQPVIMHEIVNGTEKSVLVYYIGENADDPEAQAQAKQGNKNDTLDQIKKVSNMPKDEALKETAETVPFPQTAYTAEFTISGNGHLGSDTQKGSLTTSIAGAVSYTNEDDQAPTYSGTLKYNVILTVDDMDYAKAVIQFTDCNGYSHSWTLEGYLGVAEQIKPKRPPKPKKRKIWYQDDLPPVTDPIWDTDPDPDLWPVRP